ncbi:MAG TPA: trigger factor [Streptosporangiaceae bacterium]|nr:trigger factor [Streptosporangiaceae bacterium]
MKTDVEELSPTRVKLTIEVPFSELKPSLDKAYREVAKQVRIPGFRPGRVPPRVIDTRIGRVHVLEQAVNDAVPELYNKAVAEREVVPLSQAEIEITKLEDGQELTFTAEVDIRPNFDLPDLEQLSVTVDNAEVDPDQVEEYLGSLRERFASLKTVDRPAQTGDFVSIDLAATIDGEAVEDAQATGVSYEVGTDSMLDGLDEALAGMSAGESKTFTTELAGGKRAGMAADVLVTVNSVKVKELPELDDEFAQSASEFDTVGELRASTRKQLEAMRQAGQAGQARERLLDELIEQLDIPLPERLVQAEVDARHQSLRDQLERAGLAMKAYLESAGTTQAKLDEDFEADARRSVKAGFILDKLATQEDLKVTGEQLSQYVTEQAYRMGVAPDRLAQQLSDSGQLPSVAADVLRGNALTLLAERARVIDEAGRPVYIAATEDGPVQADTGEADEADDDADDRDAEDADEG